METTYDITEVCTRLGTTSRTLRYYEEQGLIESTTDYPSRRRRYTEAQVDAIRQVLALRTLGLSVAAIRELHSSRRGAGALLGIDGGSRDGAFVEKESLYRDLSSCHFPSAPVRCGSIGSASTHMCRGTLWSCPSC